MKKIRLMVLALIIAVAMTGAGYAAWSTKIIYNNTMKTAEWNVFVEKDASDSLEAGDTVSNFNSNFVTSNSASELNKFDSQSSQDLSGAKKVSGDNFVYTMAPSITTTTENADTVNFKFFNMHPGTSVLTRFEVRNRGTIPAQIADVRVIINNGQTLSTEQQHVVNAMIVSGKFWDHIGNNPATLIGTIAPNTKLTGLAAELKRILAQEGYQLKEQHNVNLNVLDGSEVEVDNGLEFTIPADALKVNGKNVGKLAEIPVKIEFDFVQYNQNVPNAQ
jgi:hypothetical protein